MKIEYKIVVDYNGSNFYLYNKRLSKSSGTYTSIEKAHKEIKLFYNNNISKENNNIKTIFEKNNIKIIEVEVNELPTYYSIDETYYKFLSEVKKLDDVYIHDTIIKTYNILVKNELIKNFRYLIMIKNNDKSKLSCYHKCKYMLTYTKGIKNGNKRTFGKIAAIASDDDLIIIKLQLDSSDTLINFDLINNKFIG